MKTKILALLVCVLLLATTGSAFASSSPVELVLWHMEEPPNRVAQFQAAVNEFNASQSDVQVTVQVQSWNDAYDKFPAAIMAGNGPDLLFTIPDHCTVIYDLGVVQPVTDIVDEIDSTESYYDAAVAPYKYGDDVYAVPLYGMVQVLWYRADMLAAANVEPPKTWDEFLSAAKALTKDDVYGIALPASLSMATDQVIYSFMAAADAKSVIDSDNNITFNNENTLKAYQMYYDLLQYSPVDSSSYTWGEPQALLNTGMAAMAIEKGQYLSTFESESGLSADNLGCVLMPTPTGEDSSSIFYSNACMLLSSDAAKHEAAKTFFTWLLEPEHYGTFLNAEPGLFLPLTETGGTSDTYLSNEVLKTYPEDVSTLLDAISKGCLFGFTDGVSMKIGQISGPNILAQVLQQMTVNGLSAADAVAWGQSEMEAAIQ
ncbi:MAG: sugar ABC transporter substrate-binding protein [Candidatus Limiplasma sp.]|nr:sugar ABC transporter substrate-binding protein [Candidatus Limiplasma sp.]